MLELFLPGHPSAQYFCGGRLSTITQVGNCTVTTNLQKDSIRGSFLNQTSFPPLASSPYAKLG